MDKQASGNTAILCGSLDGRPIFSHSCRGRDYYTFPLSVTRLSGAEDVINVVAEKSVLERIQIMEKNSLRVTGELRSYNNRSGEGSKLKIFLYAFDIELTDDVSENSVFLHGIICKAPRFRVTPMGREICDMLLAVNRPFGHSDYLPCICWGQLARDSAGLEVGDEVELTGRIQSREYIKNSDGVRFTRTAYEVSAMEMAKL